VYLLALGHNIEPEVLGFIIKTGRLEGVKGNSNVDNVIKTLDDQLECIGKTKKE